MTIGFPLGFAQQYDSHLKHLKLKGLQPKTIDAYARAIRRLGKYFDYRIDDLSEAQLTEYFSDLIGTHSWSAVKLDLYGLKFFTVHVPKKAWVMPQTSPTSMSASSWIRSDSGRVVKSHTPSASAKPFFAQWLASFAKVLLGATPKNTFNTMKPAEHPTARRRHPFSVFPLSPAQLIMLTGADWADIRQEPVA